MNREQLLAKWAKPRPVLDHGYVRLVDVMGSPDADTAVLEAARTSTGAGPSKHKWEMDITDEKDFQSCNHNAHCSVCGEVAAIDIMLPGTPPGHCKAGDERLLRYLFRNKHVTPFEACNLKIEVKLPILVERQWVRHRAAWLNEMSARYQQLPDEFYLPDVERMQLQSTDNRQGSGGQMDDDTAQTLKRGLQDEAETAFDHYQMRLDSGLTRELARVNLPLSTYTQKIWGTSLRMAMHFLALRADTHAQWEIRQYAEVMCELLTDWAPITAQAFLDYELNAFTFSAQELAVLQELVAYAEVALDHPEGQFINKLRALMDSVDGIKPTMRERRAFRKVLGIGRLP